MADADKPISQLTPRRHRSAVKRLVNLERERNGLRPLRHASSLSLSARRWARWIVRNSQFTHGPNYKQRLDGSPYARIARRRGQRWRVGEALGWGARGSSTPRNIVDSWMASQEHRALVLGDFRHGAVWSVNDAPQTGTQRDGVTVVHHFGWRA